MGITAHTFSKDLKCFKAHESKNKIKKNNI